MSGNPGIRIELSEKDRSKKRKNINLILKEYEE